MNGGSSLSNLARKQQQTYVQPNPKTETQIKPVHKRRKITPGEKLIAGLFIAFVCFMSIKIISTQASIYFINKDIHGLETSIQTKKKVNDDLKMQVSDMSTYERIWKKAKELGLKLNENNVKVVEEK